MFVISGPSGVGKGSIVRGLLGRLEDAQLSVSVTTRPPRPGEIGGRDYLFVSDDEFARMEAAGELLESAVVYGHRYGTPLASVREAVAAGCDVLLEIDVQGAECVRARLPEAVTIFVMPPSIEELKRRLEERGTDSPDEIQRRLEVADDEIGQAPLFTHTVVNEDLESVVDEVNGIIESHRKGA